MLIRLLFRFLRPYARQAAVVIALALASTTAMLYLPNLYARIIDRGVIAHDTGYILTLGAIMLAIAAWISDSLSANTRNSVPSAIPAAIAICAVVTTLP